MAGWLQVGCETLGGLQSVMVVEAPPPVVILLPSPATNITAASGANATLYLEYGRCV